MRSLMRPNPTILNRTKNIIDSNAAVVQSKVFLDPPFGRLLEVKNLASLFQELFLVALGDAVWG
jgi:hypothetical protein